MLRSFKFLCSAATLLIALVAVPPEAVAGSTTLVDGSGGVYSVQMGAFEELFPESEACDPRDPVLALNHAGDGGSDHRLLVPGTCDVEIESNPSLAYDEASGSVFLLWQSEASTGLSRILAAYVMGDEWSEVFEVTAEAQVLQGGPRLETTSDEISLKMPDGSLGRAARRIFHVVWLEADSEDASRALYAPIILVDGEFLGTIPIVDLQEMPTGSSDRESPSSGSPLSLARPELIPGPDERSVVVGYAHPELREIVALEIRQLPAILTVIAADAEEFATDVGESLLNRPGGIEELASSIGQRIFDTALGLHTSVRSYIAMEVEQAILEESLNADGPGIPIESLAGTIGSRVIEYGSRVFGTGGLERIYEDDRLTLVSISRGAFGDAEPVGPRHLLRFYAVSSRPTPDLEGQSVTFLASSSGENGLLCWQDAPSTVRYQESEGESWGPVRSIPLSEDLGYEQVQKILRERVRER